MGGSQRGRGSQRATAEFCVSEFNALFTGGRRLNIINKCARPMIMHVTGGNSAAWQGEKPHTNEPLSEVPRCRGLGMVSIHSEQLPMGRVSVLSSSPSAIRGSALWLGMSDGDDMQSHKTAPVTAPACLREAGLTMKLRLCYFDMPAPSATSGLTKSQRMS